MCQCISGNYDCNKTMCLTEEGEWMSAAKTGILLLLLWPCFFIKSDCLLLRWLHCLLVVTVVCFVMMNHGNSVELLRLITFLVYTVNPSWACWTKHATQTIYADLVCQRRSAGICKITFQWKPKRSDGVMVFSLCVKVTSAWLTEWVKRWTALSVQGFISFTSISKYTAWIQLM